MQSPVEAIQDIDEEGSDPVESIFSLQESPWPAERIPGRFDAQKAYSPLDSKFAQSFKNAVLSDSEFKYTVNYLDNITEKLIHRSSTSDARLPYPLSMFSNFTSLPSEQSTRPLVDIFSSKVYLEIALLKLVPLNHLLRENVPDYLITAMACLGSVASDGPNHINEQLWRNATSLLIASLEVDNREARKADLLNAWVMLEVYGALSSNVSIWSKTTSVHGYVETAAYRLGRAITEERCNRNKIAIDDHASESPHNQAVHLFILIDVLRSIHYGLPATLAIPEFIYEPISLNEEFIDIYTSIVFNSRLPSQTASLDAAFLALVAILSDIHSLSTVFHSLNAIKLSPLGGTEDGTAVDEDTSQFSNPYVPFSPANENREVKGTLGKALDLWSQRYLEQVDKSVIALYYFCKLYLALPSIQLLPIVAGYHPRRTSEDEEFDYQAKALDHDLRNCNNFECLKYVWLILDHTKRSEELTPLWLPIVLFFSALMVWRMIHLQREPGIYGSLRVLKLFKAELEGMEWPCCQPMAELLESLIR